MDDVSIGLEMEHENASFLDVSVSTTVAEEKALPDPLPATLSQQKSTPVAPPPPPSIAFAVNAADDHLRVSYRCRATKCFRLQWESESEWEDS